MSLRQTLQSPQNKPSYKNNSHNRSEDRDKQISYQSLLTQLKQSQQCIKEKNQIIKHFQQRLSNQQKQIEMLLMDAQQKNLLEIKKYYVKSLEKYMKNSKYLLIEIDTEVGNGLYLPKNVKVVHFGVLQALNHSLEARNNQNKILSAENKLDPEMPLSTPVLQGKQSTKIQTNFKDLNSQIRILQQKIKAYSSIIQSKTASISDQQQTPKLGSGNKKYKPDNSEIQQFKFTSNSKTPQQNKFYEQRQKASNDHNTEYIKKLQSKIKQYQQQQYSASPIKSKSRTKTFYIRK